MFNTKQACTSLNKKLTKLSAGAESECTIYRVHKRLRNVNPNAYEPDLIAIGPYHHNKDHLKMMEDHKLRYFQHLIRRKPSNNVESYAACVGRLEAEARKCYADEPTSMSPSDFIQMLVLDGCFIVELLLKYDMVSLREKNDPIFQMNWMTIILQRDLMLFENQLPFFVLCELFDLIEAPGQHSRLRDLLVLFFGSLYPGRGYIRQESVAPREVKHLLHFIHRNWLPRSTGWRKEQDEGLQFIKSAARLKEANVRFERSESGDALFDVRFENGVMTMALLRVEDRTESFLRNLVAYEQYFGHDQDNFVTDYITFLDCLVDSSKDVEILSRNGIVENWLGEDEAVAKMVNKLGESVALRSVPCASYAEMLENVENHCRKRRNRWMATLRRTYLSSPWLIMSLLVGVVLLLLAITQTVFTILQVV